MIIVLLTLMLIVLIGIFIQVREGLNTMADTLQTQVDQMNATVGLINDYTNNLAGDLDFIVKQNQELIDRLNNGDANVVAQLQAVNSALTERAESLRSLASRIDQPVPPPPATPIETVTNPAEPVPPTDPTNPDTPSDQDQGTGQV